MGCVPDHYHLVGVGGVGMSPLAQILVGRGNTVSGSDRDHDAGHDLEILRKLEWAGVQLFPQDGSGVAGSAALVVSTAIEEDNPDLVEARRLGIPILHRAELLARMANAGRCLAITGTSGKSTVTGITGWLLEQLGADPTVMNGAIVLNWRTAEVAGNARVGQSALWVVESDESDKSLLGLRPQWALIMNASKDHFGESETLALFRQFAGQVKGRVLDGVTHPELLAGFAPVVTAQGSRFTYGGVEFEVPMPGRHNAENAFWAVRACELLGYAPAALVEPLRRFQGIHRRLEKVGVARGVTVIDDYAHNPAKIEASLRAVTPTARRVFAVWRPHGFRPLRTMLDELTAVMRAECRAADRVFILPVYDAGGTADRSVNAGALVAKLQAAGVVAEALAGPEVLPARLAGEVGDGDVVLIMGARDPHLPALARQVLAAING